MSLRVECTGDINCCKIIIATHKANITLFICGAMTNFEAVNCYFRRFSDTLCNKILKWQLDGGGGGGGGGMQVV